METFITFWLFVIAVGLAILTTVVSFVHGLFKYGFKWSTLSGYFFNMAYSIDVFGAYAFRSLWNDWLIQPDGYKFGAPGETMSSALGRNKQIEKFKTAGVLIYLVLYFVDIRYWRSGGHCINSIQDLEK